MQIDITPSLLARFWSKVDKNGPVPDRCPELGPCWLWTASRNPKGYGQIGVGRTLVGAHRVAWILANGDIPAETPCVLHHCDVRACVNAAHLWLGTVAQNQADMARKGRGRGKVMYGDANPSRLHPERLAHGDRNGRRLHPERYWRVRPVPMPGEANHQAKLTEADVVAIRAALEAGTRQTDLAARFGVSQAKISQINLRKAWRHLP